MALLKQTQLLENTFESNLLTVDYSVEPDTSDSLLKNEWCARNCSSSTVHLSQSPQTPVLKLYGENKHIYSLLQQPGLVSMETIFLTTVSCLTRIKTKRLLWMELLWLRGGADKAAGHLLGFILATSKHWGCVCGAGAFGNMQWNKRYAWKKLLLLIWWLKLYDFNFMQHKLVGVCVCGCSFPALADHLNVITSGFINTYAAENHSIKRWIIKKQNHSSKLSYSLHGQILQLHSDIQTVTSL